MIKLGPISECDLPAILRWRNDERIYKWCRQFEEISESHHEAWFRSLFSNSKCRMYGVYDTGERLVGVTGLTSIDYINRHAEFSLYIDPERHGAGLGEAALRAICDHGFSVLNLNHIWGEVFQGNPALAMFKKVGFKQDGIRRDFYYRQGVYIDAVLVSILKTELLGV